MHTGSGMLWNTEGGSPMLPIGEADLPTALLGSTAPTGGALAPDGRARVFQGGYYLDLHKMLGIRGGAECLYVGDHIYGEASASWVCTQWYGRAEAGARRGAAAVS